ncbi:NAD-dependent epimerase/dehydratase family protein [Salipiger abyssi]|uniref:NAD-dependent epimerase/dehydratase family protein n=1 Tax=Salipiger abyssi TaxID=1250539 RepID=UPI004059075C
MGEVRRILITGAGGFIGRACVTEARARGIEVVAVVRRTVAAEWSRDAGIALVTADLSDPASVAVLAQALQSCDAAIHAAAHLGGDAEKIAADTLSGTRHLLAALPEGLRLVLVSSIVVYDTMTVAPGAVLDERSALAAPGHAPDAYAEAKLAQEALARAAGHPLWLIRPGAVWGPGRTWHALNGVDAGPLHITLTSDGVLPIVHVTQLAKALIAAALTDPGGIRALNAVDDDLPTRSRYVAAHRRATGRPKLSMALPWTVWLGLAKLLRPLAPRLPGLLREPVLRARIMPLRWPNTALRAALGGKDAAGYEQMLERSTRGAE